MPPSTPDPNPLPLPTAHTAALLPALRQSASAPHPMAPLVHLLQQIKDEEGQDPPAAVLADMLLVSMQ